MAKSLRSKVKRSYRAKKREDGVYAASEAARLHRLNAKLKSTVDTALQRIPEDAEEEDAVKDAEEQQDPSGWSWFATFGLLDACDITPESLDSLQSGVQTPRRRSGQRQSKRKPHHGRFPTRRSA